MIKIGLGVALFAALSFVSAPPSYAACKWVWNCSNGPCKHVPVCDSPVDIVPPEPAGIPPIAPPSVRPIERPTVPPVGARSCHKEYIVEDGKASWKTICR